MEPVIENVQRNVRSHPYHFPQISSRSATITRLPSKPLVRLPHFYYFGGHRFACRELQDVTLNQDVQAQAKVKRYVISSKASFSFASSFPLESLLHAQKMLVAVTVTVIRQTGSSLIAFFVGLGLPQNLGLDSFESLIVMHPARAFILGVKPGRWVQP
ncbi:hypothetical protein K439DRAFT_194764 [Ramaria rubella]|nr:hypothetical protein K439DRAFT_194764 [Ramaria rubella]